MGRDLAEDFDLLDGVDAQVGLEVEFVLEHVGGVSGLLGDDFLDGGQQIPGRCRCGFNGGRRCLDGGGHIRDRHFRRCWRGFHLGNDIRIDTQGVVDDLQPWLLQTRYAAQPVLVNRIFLNLVLHNPAHHQKGEMGAETRGIVQTVLVAAAILAAAELQVLELLGYLREVGDGRYPAGLQGFDHDGVLDGGAQGMACESLGVGDGDVAIMVGISGFERAHLGGGTAAARRCEGFMGHENHLTGVLGRVDIVAGLHPSDEAGHFFGQVGLIDLGGMKGAVADIGAQDFGLAVQAAVPEAVFPLDDQGNGAGAQNGAVALGIEGFGCIGDHFLDTGGPQGQEPGGDPGALGLRGGGLPAHDDDPLAATGANPVFGHAHRLSGGGAGAAHHHVGALGLDQLGKVGRAQGHHVEEQVAFELVGAVSLAPLLDLEEPVRDLGLDLCIAHGLHKMVVDVLEFLVGPHIELVVVVLVELLDQGFESRKQRGHDDPGGGLHLLGQGVAVGDAVARGGQLVLEYQRDVGVLHCLDAGGDGERDGDIVVVVHAVFVLEVEIAELAGELNHFTGVGDVEEAGITVRLFENPRDVHVDDFFFFFPRKRFDEIVAGKQFLEIVGIEDLVAASRQPDGGTGHHGLAHVEIKLLHGLEGLFAFLFEVFLVGHIAQSLFVAGHEILEIGTRRHGVFYRGRRSGRWWRNGWRHGGRGRGLRRDGLQQVVGLQAGDPFGERSDFALFGVDGRRGLEVFDGDILEQVDQYTARADFVEALIAGLAGVFDRGDEFHRGDDLAHEKLFDAGGIGRVGRRRHIGDHAAEIHRVEADGFQVGFHLFGRPVEERRVEGAGKGQFLEHHLGVLQIGPEAVDVGSGARNGGLLRAVLVGHVDVLDLRVPDQGMDGRGVLEHDHDAPGMVLGGGFHEVGALDDETHGGGEVQQAGAIKRAVLAHAVADEQIGGQAAGLQIAKQGGRTQKDGRLGVFGLVQAAVLAEHDLQQTVAAHFLKDLLALVEHRADLLVFIIEGL